MTSFGLLGGQRLERLYWKCSGAEFGDIWRLLSSPACGSKFGNPFLKAIRFDIF